MGIPKQGKSFKQMKEARQANRDRNERWNGLTQSFSSREELQAAMYLDASSQTRSKPVESKTHDRWGNYIGPEKADKGQKNGSCNITACQKPKAIFYNHSMDRYYCVSCARKLNDANRDAVAQYGHPLCTLDPEFIES